MLPAPSRRCAGTRQPRVRGRGGRGRAATRQLQPGPPLPGLAWLQSEVGLSSTETRTQGPVRDRHLVTGPTLSAGRGPMGPLQPRGSPGVNPSLLLSPAFLPPPSSSAFPCRSLVSSPRPGPGHAPVHFRLLLWPPRFLQDEEEEGGSSQAAGNSGVSGTGALLQPPPLVEAWSRKPPSHRGSSQVTPDPISPVDSSLLRVAWPPAPEFPVPRAP